MGRDATLQFRMYGVSSPIIASLMDCDPAASDHVPPLRCQALPAMVQFAAALASSAAETVVPRTTEPLPEVLVTTTQYFESGCNTRLEAVNSSEVPVSSSRPEGLPKVRRRAPGRPSSSAWMATLGVVPPGTDMDSLTQSSVVLTGLVVKAWA